MNRKENKMMDDVPFLLIAFVGFYIVFEIIEKIGNRRHRDKPPENKDPFDSTLGEREDRSTEKGELTERENLTERGIRLPKSKPSKK